MNALLVLVALSQRPAASIIQSEPGVLPLKKSIPLTILGEGSTPLAARLKGAGYTVSTVATSTGKREPIPSQVLLAEPPGEGKGMTGRYFPNPVLMQGPVNQRTDRQIDFKWGSKSPAENVPANNYSVSWNGKLVSPFTGDVKFAIEAEGGCRLLIDGETVIDDWKQKPLRISEGAMRLTKGRSYSLVVHYFKEKGSGTCRLLWTVPSAKTATSTKSDTLIMVVSAKGNSFSQAQIDMLSEAMALKKSLVVIALAKPTVDLSKIKAIAKTVIIGSSSGLSEIFALLTKRS